MAKGIGECEPVVFENLFRGGLLGDVAAKASAMRSKGF